MGDPGGVSLYGTKPERHRLFAEYLTAEYSIRTEGQGRTINVWKLPPSKPDNLYLPVGRTSSTPWSAARSPRQRWACHWQARP